MLAACLELAAQLRHGDLVLLCTDGMLDNLFDDELLAVLADFAYDTPVADIAHEVVRHSVRYMGKGDRLSPFAARATDEGICILGGKMDDVTVCVARALNVSR